MTFTPSQVRAYYAYRFQHLKLTNQREWRMPCPVHQGKDSNFAINSETGLAQCHSRCGRGWDILSLEQELSGLDFPRTKDKVFEVMGLPKVPWDERNVEAIYDYTDESGKILYQVLRYPTTPKQFKQRRPDGAGGWIWGLGETRRVPYRLEKLGNAGFIGIAEGEKCVLALERIGMTATCNSGGAGKFLPEFSVHFAGKHVAIFHDNDEPGRDHALKVAAILTPVAKSLKIIEIPDLPDKGDIADFIGKGGTIDQIRELYRKAQQWTPEWEFSRPISNENDRYVRTMEMDIESAGGAEKFWDLSKLCGLETPWERLSWALGGGLRPGEVYVIGGNQGSGKTSLALQFAIAAMRRNEGVLMFSMEMNSVDVYQRMAGIEAWVNLKELRHFQVAMKGKSLTPEERINYARQVTEMQYQLARPTRELRALPMIVHTKPAVTPAYIIEESARLTKLQPVKLILVDHMQLMNPDDRKSNEYEKMTAVSRTMKQVAVDLGVPLLLCSQTSRANARDHRAELECADLRGAGAIEEDAAGVMLIYEDKEDRDRATQEGERYVTGPVKCWLKVDKNRFGEKGRCFELWHSKTATRFDLLEDLQAHFNASASAAAST
jgi:replicative DNA helicase